MVGHEAIKGSEADLIPVRQCLLSVSDKTDLIPFATALHNHGVKLLSTGGTASSLRAANLPVTDVSEYTGFPEILDGRVKTLHPLVHGGILAVRGNPLHEKQSQESGIQFIDMVVLNLYPFEQVLASSDDFNKCIENVDIGGPAMLRASAKNFQYVAAVTSPSQYQRIISEMSQEKGMLTKKFRQWLAAEAFALSAAYDAMIASFFAKSVNDVSTDNVTRRYKKQLPLKYGCNPNQTPACLYSINTSALPFEVICGTPGYINFLDALNAWQLVKELREAVNLPAAASFKHVSPAGAAVAVRLTEEEAKSYEVDIAKQDEFSLLELAYIRARQADPMSSFGDFIALSDIVDIRTAKRIKSDISDGIIAPGFEPEALDILEAKKGGKFIILKVDPKFMPEHNEIEFREVFGVGFSQKRNTLKVSKSQLENVVTKNKDLSEEAKRDLVVGNVALKYTQSNSVGFAKNGQMIGVGAGQQSRVDCVKLSGKKARIWCLRMHPKVQNLTFKSSVKRQERINARVAFIENDFNEVDIKDFLALFENPNDVKFLTPEEISTFLATQTGISLVSDAFFPFRDNIDVAYNLKFKVKYIAQAGGSVQDQSIIDACDQYGMVMALTGQRLFHH